MSRQGVVGPGYVNEAFSRSQDDGLELETVELGGDSDPDDNNFDNVKIAVHPYGLQNPIEIPPGVSPCSESPPGEMDDHLKESDAEKSSLRCGVLMVRPNCLQRYRTAKWALLWLCFAAALQGMVINGFVNVVITTIERRFGLRSSQTGLVAGGYDLASFLCLVPVSYLGGRKGASKPRWIGWGVALMGLGSLVFALPYFASPLYSAPGHMDLTCQRVTNLTQSKGECSSGESNGSMFPWPLVVFLIAQYCHGAGASPLYTLGVTYLDENVSKKMSSVYLGIFYTMSIIGPAVGYVVGGQLLQIYTDFLYVNVADIGLTSSSNVWIGAWWIGFLLSATLCFLVALPIMAFPSSLPGSEELRKEKVSEAYDGDSSRTEAFTKMKELPHAFIALMKNPTFVFLNLAGATEGILLSGFAAFLPKLIENQFSITASKAAILMGIITVPAGGGGTFAGGYLVKKLKLQCSGILRLCVWTTLAAVLFSVSFIISCPNLPFAGLTQSYGLNNIDTRSPISLDASCNQGCSCTKGKYDPVCGIDGVMYYSPCYAGCTGEISVDGSKAYEKCTCVSGNLRNNGSYTSNTTITQSEALKTVKYDAINTTCTSDCPYLYVFIVMALICMLFTFLSTMPALSATLRCVREDQRSFALGIQWIKVRLLGTIPAPMVFGILIDKSCILWQQSCDGKGACLVYNNKYMSRYMISLAMIVKALSLLFFFCAWWFYKAPGTKSTLPTNGVCNIQGELNENNHCQINGSSINEKTKP